VLTVFKGGAFARYRVGDVFRCTGIGSETENNTIPRFQYVDRVPQIIDIAGFTRITEKSITQAIQLSRLPIASWTAKKEFTDQHRPYLHLYVELQRSHLINSAKTRGRKSAIEYLVKKMGETGEGYDNETVFIAHGDCPEDAQALAEMVKEQYGVKNVVIGYVGPVIGAHTGPGVLVVFYMGQHR